MDIRISPDVVLARERGRPRKGIIAFLSLAVAFLTVVMLINPATTEEYAPACGMEEHEHSEACIEIVQRMICPLEEREGHVHGEECWEVQSVLVCTIPEEAAHTHTEDCIVWEESYICGLEDDPEHVHTDECLEKTPVYVCGLEESEGHRHTGECYEEQKKLICALPEGQVHEHTEDCIRWEETCVCGLEHDPEHVHTDECFVKTPVFVCEPEEGAGHVHNDLCYQEETVYTCGLTAHVHTDECFPKLTGDPHADVEINLDWESTFCNVELTGVWADDLVAIARSQIGYAESERNYVTDEYNVRHGYTRYGDWNGTRYSGWNGLYVMFCLHYAGVWTIPTDPVPSNWMNAARAQGFWTEKEGLPVRGDLVFFDDDADGLADRVAIVTEIREDGFDMISGGTGKPVEEETVLFDSDKLLGYLALPQNPDYVTLEDVESEPAEGQGTDTLKAEGAAADEETIPEAEVPLADPYAPVLLTAETEDGVRATLNAPAAAFPYPAEELTLMIRDAEEAADLTGTVESDGAEFIGVRWLDISVWHEETVEEPAVPIPDAELPVPELHETAELVEPTEPADVSEPADMSEPIDASEAVNMQKPIDSLGSFEQIEAVSMIEPTDSAELTVERDQADSTDVQPEEVQPVKETKETDIAVPVPEDPEKPAEARLVKVVPVEPVEITVEGLSEDGSIWVYHMQEDGAVERTDTKTNGTRGSVSVITGLN